MTRPSSLTDEQVKTAIALKAQGKTLRAIAEIIGVSAPTVMRLLKARSPSGGERTPQGAAERPGWRAKLASRQGNLPFQPRYAPGVDPAQPSLDTLFEPDEQRPAQASAERRKRGGGGGVDADYLKEGAKAAEKVADGCDWGSGDVLASKQAWAARVEGAPALEFGPVGVPTSEVGKPGGAAVFSSPGDPPIKSMRARLRGRA